MGVGKPPGEKGNNGKQAEILWWKRKTTERKKQKSPIKSENQISFLIGKSGGGERETKREKSKDFASFRINKQKVCFGLYVPRRQEAKCNTD